MGISEPGEWSSVYEGFCSIEVISKICSVEHSGPHCSVFTYTEGSSQWKFSKIFNFIVSYSRKYSP
jgi:hypothetical protein